MKNLHSVLLFVVDLEASIAFYRDKLEFDVDYVAPGEIAMLRFGIGQLILHPPGKHDKDTGVEKLIPGNGVIINFATDEIDAYYSRLLAREVSITQAIRDETWGDRDFYLKDRDGFELCFAQRITQGN